MKKIIALLLALITLTAFTVSCSKELEPEGPYEFSEEKTDHVILFIEGDGFDGQIVIKLRPDVAPISVENFKKLVSEGFYDGLIFHRVIYNFMVQGGDPTGTGMGGSDQNIKGEFSSNGVENELSHKRGVVSMARSSLPDSASSQFFIVHKDSPHLDGDYAAFGEVVYGIGTVDAIAKVTTDGNDKPLKNVTIVSARFVNPTA